MDLVVMPTGSSRYNMSLDIGSLQLEMTIAYGSDWVHWREKSRVFNQDLLILLFCLFRVGEDSEGRLQQRV